MTTAFQALAPKPAPPPLARILVVDDDESIRVAMVRFLQRCGYGVESAGNGTDALHKFESEDFDAMICDVRMPGLSGPELLPRVLARDPNLAVLMLSAVNDAPTAAHVLAGGAIDYLVKPIELRALQDAVIRALARRQSRMEKERFDARIQEEVQLRTAELEQEKESLRRLSVSVVETLIIAMEAKDVYLRGHSLRVADLAGEIAIEMGQDHSTVERIRLAGRLHDVGKIGIREEILNKPASLTVPEFEHVKQHVRIGIEILKPLQHLEHVLDFIHHHHEHWDGSGYPQGIKGDHITLGGRILAGADAFDALTSQRAYRDPMRADDSLAYLGTVAGALLDPQVVQALQVVMKRRLATA
ncbi:MAG: response regulator [Gemmatimonadaceae bacterium]|nr:response regulator [Gemmatimonadaceae bacterium]